MATYFTVWRNNNENNTVTVETLSDYWVKLLITVEITFIIYNIDLKNIKIILSVMKYDCDNVVCMYDIYSCMICICQKVHLTYDVNW